MPLRKKNVSVVLNVYKRPQMLESQLNALTSQTYPVSEVLIWNNGNSIEISSILEKYDFKFKYAYSHTNLGVWARFSFALNAENEFLCIFDDDVIPGNKWIENCMTSFESQPGIYGARGLKFDDKMKYTPNTKVGWAYPNGGITRVDIVGHAWFFKTEWLSHYWGQTDIREMQMHSGEDMQLSFALQKAIGVGTYVPPHPAHDTALWGNINGDNQISSDTNAISLKPGAFEKFDTALKKLRKRGFTAINNSEIPNALVNTRMVRKILRTETWNRNGILYNKGRYIAKQLRRIGIHF